jgi:N-acetylglutamate synthase-like GNAT family acetyltransferase
MVNPLSSHRTRRATTDDLGQLKALWQTEQFLVGELEKQFTDFQVAEGERGEVAAAIALQIAGSQGRIHSETFADFGQTDLLRPRLWHQLQTTAQLLGLFRLWTRETAPFWRKDAGFTEASRECLEELPAGFGPAGPGWLALRIREEGAEPEALNRQFELFKIAEQEKREKMLRRAALLRFIGTFIAFVLFASAFLLLLWVFKHRAP